MTTQQAKLVAQLDRGQALALIQETERSFGSAPAGEVLQDKEGLERARILTGRKVSQVFWRLGLPLEKVSRIAFFQKESGGIDARVEASLTRERKFIRDGVAVVRQEHQLLTWDWRILIPTPAPAPKPEPKAEAPKPEPPAPVPAPEVAPIPAGEACEVCKNNRAEFMTEIMNAQGESEFIRLCGACHGRAKADKESFIDSCKI